MSIKFYNGFNTHKIIMGCSTGCGGMYRHMRDIPNYESLAEACGVSASRMIRLKQEHSDKILVADERHGGEGIIKDTLHTGYDAVITDTAGLLISAAHADCMPVFIYDRAHHAVGIAHSGRAGTALEIALKTVLKMQEVYASDPSELKCLLGPHLCAEHHTVRAQDADIFNERFSPCEVRRIVQCSAGVYHINMKTAVEISLARAGVRAENIICDCRCTYENKDLFSWRRDHTESRALSFIAIK